LHNYANLKELSIHLPMKCVLYCLLLTPQAALESPRIATVLAVVLLNLDNTIHVLVMVPQLPCCHLLPNSAHITLHHCRLALLDSLVCK
jgi:hypothetical protein